MDGEVGHSRKGPRPAAVQVPGTPASLRPSRGELAGVWVLLAVAVAFGVLVEFRSAFLRQRMGDLTVFVRTAWAVRAGQDIYAVTDDKGFHYLYPPLFAILLAPLADAPAGVERTWILPYAATAAIWYVFNVLCLVVAVHWLAGALERRASDPAVRALPRGTRRWWALRLWPVLACLPSIGHTLMRGQVGLLLLLLLCGMAAAALRGRSGRAGLWLAAAICLKIIPAFLLLYPLWRRDFRWLAGCAAGLVVGLLVIPAAVFGPARTFHYFREWNEVMLLPAMAEGQDQSRAKELLQMTATDSQSLLVTLHNTVFPDRATRPLQPLPWERLLPWVVGGLLTVLALAAGRRSSGDGLAAVLLLGLLVLLMLLLSPVCHLHYFCLAVPLVMALLAARWEHQVNPQPHTGMALLVTAYVIAGALPHVPGLELVRDLGLAMHGTLLLWGVGCVVLWKRTRMQGDLPEQPEVTGAAA